MVQFSGARSVPSQHSMAINACPWCSLMSKIVRCQGDVGLSRLGLVGDIPLIRVASQQRCIPLDKVQIIAIRVSEKEQAHSG